MKRWLLTVPAVIATLTVVALLLWQATVPEKSAPEQIPFRTASGEPIQALTPPVGLDPDKIALGKALFADPRLSHDNSVACATCHMLKPPGGGADGRQTAIGIAGQRGEVNTPTVFNASLNFVQFWDGRAATLEEQAAGPVHNPLEMGSNWKEVIAKLSTTADYPAAFNHIYSDGITGANIADAIATFERSLVTPGSRFDNWLQGQGQALSDQEREGYRLFKEFGCISCHQGTNIGGNMYQKFGIFGDFRPANRPPRKSDLGRFNVTGRQEDKAVFKVPGLRNIARTAPYFHDGSAPDLPTAVATMARVQLGRDISPQEISLIVQFLESTTGRYQDQPL